MKKLNKLFAILIAVLGVGTLSAQTWTQSGEYYLYNESSKTFLSRGASWGTHAVTDKYGVPFAWDPAEGSIKFLDSDACLFITGDGLCFTDNKSTGWTFEAVNGNTCLLKGTENRYLKQENDGVLTLTTTADEAVAWTFKTPAERNAIVATYPTENYAAIIQAAGLSVEASAFVDALYGSNFARKDMTSSIGTAKFSGNAGSWTWTQVRGQEWQPAYGTNFAEVFQATGTYSQKVSNLPSGIYKLTVNGFHRQGGWEKCNDLNNRGYQLSTATLEGNGQAVALKPWVTERTGDNNPNNTGQAVDAFNAGKYNNEVYVYVAEDGILDISVNIKNHVGGAWVLFNNFTLTYFSDQVSAEDASNILALAEAVSGTMPDAVAEELAAAKSAFESNQTIANYNALAEAIETANNYTEWYTPIQKEIEKAEALGIDVATYKANVKSGAYKTKAESLVAVETLMTEEYTYVRNTFPYDVTLSDTWNSKGTGTQAATFDKEHWSGEKRGYKNQDDSNGQGWNASAWTIDFDQEVTLPAGDYVFKVAGRKSENAILALAVTKSDETLGSVSDFPNGSTGLGINKIGAASFDANDPSGFANNGNGFGWQWRYIKFKLTNEATVKIAIHAEANEAHQWASFGDYTLHMDEAAYFENNKDGLIAPMAAAQALVGTIPMGATEAAALEDAIDLPVTTGAELKAKIDALNAAIEAVENWRRDYSEAKALLVAALERFEADFNDGANGALRFMPAEAWNNILNAVAEAAKAKDVLDSYDGFETAANNLHAAMDAVYASYIKYDILENLTSLIGNADCTANDAWPGSGRSTKDDQHWSGQKRIYFAQNHENGAARSQTITLPKDGTYLLKVAVRAVEAASYAEILINGVSYKTVGAHGRTGGTIATDGTEWENIQAGIDAGKTFANNNQGYGWVYTYIYFDAKAGENTIAINLSNFNSSREANCGGMELYYLRPNYTVVEDGVVEYYGEFDEVTGTAYATHDVTNATLKENSIDVTANPNTFIIANENQVSNEDNVIVDGTTASLVLNEGYAFYAATDFTATAATYSREFTKDTWLTVCLPFAYDVPENVEVETLSTVEADTKTFVFNKVDVMEANKPYIIKNGTENNALFAELSNVEVKATPDVMSTSAEEGDAEFIGTYTTVTTDVLMENGTYDILFFGTDGQLYYLSDGITQNVITIDPFRAYIRLPKGTIDWENGAAQAIARHGEGTTGIEPSTLNAQPSTVIYDLMGRKVTNMVKGNMYIVNGKKVIVK